MGVELANRKKTSEWAKYKNRKRIQRRYKFYTPRTIDRRSRINLWAPSIFSIIESREKVIAYFKDVFDHSKRGDYVVMNMGKIIKTDALTVSLVIAIMMDSRRSNVDSFVKHVKVVVPTGNSQPAEVFKKSHFRDTVTTHNANQNYFMSRTDMAINTKYTGEIIDFAESRGVSDAKTILNPLLVEIFSNTNNHASLYEEKVPWFLSIMDDGEMLCFSVIDLGIGIYESLRTSRAIRKIPQKEFNIIDNMYDNRQSKYLSYQIPRGVYSSTKEACRGKGLKEIYEKANNSTTCKRFVIISNKAMVDLLNINKIQDDSGFSFDGTAFYWEMEK